MAGLVAILGRELRQTVRRRTLHRLRLFGALSALGVSLVVLLPYASGMKAGNMGHEAFAVLVWLAYVLNLLAGPVFASDMVSGEKREGTLGLLMLTPLRSYEVVAGKLAAVWMPGLQVMLAIVPVFSLVFFMGGITAGELGRTFLALAGTLVLSLCLALACSCLSSRAIAGMVLATLGLLAVAALLPFYNATPVPGVIRSEFLAWSSPTTAIRLVTDAEYTAASERFWACLGTQVALGITSVMAAGLLLGRTWRTDTRLNAWRSVFQRATARARSAGPSRRNAQVLLDTEPFVWLADRLGGSLRWTWALALASTTASLIVLLDRVPGSVTDFAPLFLSFYCGHGAMKLWVAWHASRRLAEDRRSGVLEMLLCLPMQESDIWGGWLLLLKRRLLWPFLTLMLAQAFMVCAGLFLWGAMLDEGLYLAALLLVMAVFLVADAYTLCWSAFAHSLSSRSSAAALARAVLLVLFLPVLPAAAIVMAGTPVALVIHPAVLVMWVALSFGVNLGECARGHARVVEGFRELLSGTCQPPPDASAAWKALSAVRKRVLSRMAGSPLR